MANDSFTAEFSGVDKLLKELKTYPDKVRKKALNASVRKGAGVIRSAVRKNAKALDDPSTTESIAKNVFARASTKEGKKVGGVVFKVGIRGGAKSKAQNESNPGGDTWYWRLIEFGTQDTPARPFMRPAFAQSQSAAAAAIASELKKQLDKIRTG